MKIPFTKTTVGEEEKRAIAKVIDGGWLVMGKKTQEFEKKFARYVGAKYAVFVDSGTAALFLALRAQQFEKWVTIRVPSLTFVSTAEIVVNAGLEPIFSDVDLDTLSLKKEFGGMFSIPVHLTGNLSRAKAKIYDSAHRIEKNDVRGSDAMWCYSFYATKNLTTIQGGMIALNDEKKYLWLKKARDHGITKGTLERYKKGDWEYSIDFVGFRLKADDVRAVVGLEQLKKLPQNTKKRNTLMKLYNSLLGTNNKGNHIFPILVEKRPEFIKFLRSRGIQASVHFLPLHKMPAFRQYATGDLTNTNYLGDRLVSLPLYPQMTRGEVEYVVKGVKDSGLMI